MHRVHAEEFVALAIKVLATSESTTQYSLPNGTIASRYEDERIAITSNQNGLSLEIVRKSQVGSEERHLHISNPVTMVDVNGDIIRHHGEHAQVTDHLTSLLAEASTD